MVSLTTYCDLTKAHFDAIIGDPTSAVIDETVVGLLNARDATTFTVSTPTMDGNELTLYSVEAGDLEVYETPVMVEGLVSLENMASGDVLVVKEYSSVESPVAYKSYVTHTYKDAQTSPIIHFIKKIGAFGWKITAQQTSGTNRVLKCFFIRRRFS